MYQKPLLLVLYQKRASPSSAVPDHCEETNGAPLPTAGGEIEKSGEENDWIKPLKTNRSPEKQKVGLIFGEVSILSNPYSFLSEKDDLGEVDLTN